MLKIIEKSPEKLVIEKVPVIFYAFCGFLLVAGLTCGVLLSGAIGSETARLVAGIAILVAAVLLLSRGETTLIWINTSNRVLYYGKRGIFTVRTRKFHFSEIDGISLRQEKDVERITGGRCGIILENAGGLKKKLLDLNNQQVARQTSELMKTYLTLG